ncbi:MAG: hypothetical protein HYY01_03760 [Chloroflexi bacterium]|nr:hypothetical protein [Chloroflexota bacterium]
MAEYDKPGRGRPSLRLPSYDYSWPGAYFITTDTQGREALFGDARNGEVRLNALGQVVADCWSALPSRYPGIELDTFAVMPDHVHGIIIVVAEANVAAIHELPLRGAGTGGVK